MGGEQASHLLKFEFFTKVMVSTHVSLAMNMLCGLMLENNDYLMDTVSV